MTPYVAVDPNVAKAIEIANQDSAVKRLSGVTPTAYKLSEDRVNSYKQVGYLPVDVQNIYMVDYKGHYGLSVLVDVDAGKVLRKFGLTEVGA